MDHTYSPTEAESNEYSARNADPQRTTGISLNGMTFPSLRTVPAPSIPADRLATHWLRDEDDPDTHTGVQNALQFTATANDTPTATASQPYNPHGIDLPSSGGFAHQNNHTGNDVSEQNPFLQSEQSTTTQQTPTSTSSGPNPPYSWVNAQSGDLDISDLPILEDPYRCDECSQHPDAICQASENAWRISKGTYNPSSGLIRKRGAPGSTCLRCKSGQRACLWLKSIQARKEAGQDMEGITFIS